MDHHARRDRALLREPAKRHNPGIGVANRMGSRDAGSQSPEYREGMGALQGDLRHGAHASVKSRKTDVYGKSAALAHCWQVDDLRRRAVQSARPGVTADNAQCRPRPLSHRRCGLRVESIAPPSLSLYSTPCPSPLHRCASLSEFAPRLSEDRYLHVHLHGRTVVRRMSSHFLALARPGFVVRGRRERANSNNCADLLEEVPDYEGGHAGHHEKS